MGRDKNARELLSGVADWLGDQDENLSAGLRSALDGLRLYEYWQARASVLPEYCDEPADDECVDVAAHRVAALGYDPLETCLVESRIGAAACHEALQKAERLIDSVAYVSQEGDTDGPLAAIRLALNPMVAPLYPEPGRPSFSEAFERAVEVLRRSGSMEAQQQALSEAIVAMAAESGVTLSRAPEANALGGVFTISVVGAEQSDNAFLRALGMRRAHISADGCRILISEGAVQNMVMERYYAGIHAGRKKAAGIEP